jgi:hypothetical protein
LNGSESNHALKRRGHDSPAFLSTPATRIERDFFVNNYDDPLFEDGIQLFDMLRLTLKYVR